MKVSALLGLMQTLLLLCSVHTLAVAQESSGPAPAPVAVAPIPAEEDAAAPLSISGFVDAYYFHSFNNTVFPTSFTPNNESFSLGMANVVFSKTGKVGFVADLAFGPAPKRLTDMPALRCL
ncbi:MAG: outer membrane beta-barrel protein [Haliscomenobacter sp.]|nr:outer membrane beta-barrel protein [Haliscomenobacter sp.]